MLGGRVDGLLVVACALERLEGVGEGRCASRFLDLARSRVGWAIITVQVG